MNTLPRPWAILLCRFSDVATEPQPVAYYEDLFARYGLGGLCDYFRSASCGALDISGSRVFGWFDSGHTGAEYEQLASTLHSGCRPIAVQWAKDAARAAGVDLAPFGNVLALFNIKPVQHDHGATGSDVLIVQAGPDIVEFGFIAHEMGHGLGLAHSWAANPDFEYGDGWDLMSWQTTQFTFTHRFRATEGLATVGLNAHNLMRLGALPDERIWSPAQPDFSTLVVLDPLGLSPVGQQGALALRFGPDATRPPRANGSSYLAEFRRRAGWDQAIPRDAVLIHEVRANGACYAQPGRWIDHGVGDRFESPDPRIGIQVQAIDASTGSASLRVWDLAEGSLRREDNRPEVVLIEGGLKRWIRSPAVLQKMGRNWSDVRLVPDGVLAALGSGPDLDEVLLDVTPTPPPLNRPVSVTVRAHWQTSGQPADGQVIINGVVVGRSNQPFTYTFRPRRVRSGPGRGDWDIVYPTGVLSLEWLPEVPIDFGFEN